jgi:PKD repeat protein
MKRLIFSSLLALAISACESVPDYRPVALPLTADFSINGNTDSIRVGQLLDISNHSQGASAYVWDWGEGNRCNDRNPYMYYTVAGTFLVTLTTKNGSGETALDSQTITIVP